MIRGVICDAWPGGCGIRFESDGGTPPSLLEKENG